MEYKLPLLPEPKDEVADIDGFVVKGMIPVYTAGQMQAYAIAAIEAQVVPDLYDLRNSLVAISSAVAEQNDMLAQALIGDTLAMLASAQPAPQAKPDRTGMTYYKKDACKAPSAEHPDCICWTPAPQASEVQQDAAVAWQQGYDLGVIDERTSEANIGIAGFNAKVNPARQNPYTHPAQQAKPQPLSDEQIEKGRQATFSTNNPFCPCDSKTMRKAVRWAEAAHGIQGS